jgi:hypothetical protein
MLRSVLLAAGVLSLAACATQPGSTPLLEKKFQREANHYMQYQHEGMVVYCKRGATRSLPPSECITETGLRARVESYERDRNPVMYGGPQYVATVPGNTSGG